MKKLRRCRASYTDSEGYGTRCVRKTGHKGNHHTQHLKWQGYFGYVAIQWNKMGFQGVSE